jgi:hypothetical protein
MNLLRKYAGELPLQVQTMYVGNRAKLTNDGSCLGFWHGTRCPPAFGIGHPSHLLKINQLQAGTLRRTAESIFLWSLSFAVRV